MRVADLGSAAKKTVEDSDITAVKSTLLEAEMGVSGPTLLEKSLGPLRQRLGRKRQE